MTKEQMDEIKHAVRADIFKELGIKETLMIKGSAPVLVGFWETHKKRLQNYCGAFRAMDVVTAIRRVMCYRLGVNFVTQIKHTDREKAVVEATKILEYILGNAEIVVKGGGK